MRTILTTILVLVAAASHADPRARDLGVPFDGQPGPLNAITDVTGVTVGHVTLIVDLADGHKVRTGVTAILPRGRSAEMIPAWAGIAALNGNGEMTGSHWIADGGHFYGPIILTNTHSVGIAHHAAIGWMIDTYPAFHAEHVFAMPVVAETYDGVLNDINGRHIREEHVRAALDCATGVAVAEGAVGGGTGMICYEFKGGTGTASRRLEIDGETFHLGALVQANHGMRPWFTLLGKRVGEAMPEGRFFDAEQGSIIVILGTDLPMAPHQLHRLAKRAAIGVGRGGSPGGNNSGDIFLAFSTANRGPIPQLAGPRRSFEMISDEQFDPIYMAAIQSIEEAVVNAILAAEDMTTLRPAGHICRAIDAEKLAKLFSEG
jgi:D-aminopeptidase